MGGERRDLVVIGGGEHARVLIEAARTRPDVWNVLGFVDPEPCLETQRRLALEQLGGDEAGLRQAAAGQAAFAIGVGSVGVSDRRRQVAERYDAAGVTWAVVVHAAAWVSPTARLAEGALICGGAQVNSGARLGRHAVVNTGAIVEHDVELGGFCQIGPGAAIAGAASIGEDSYVGLGARVRDHVKIGRRATVGMGAVVVADVADEALVAGVPARPLEGRRR